MVPRVTGLTRVYCRPLADEFACLSSIYHTKGTPNGYKRVCVSYVKYNAMHACIIMLHKLSTDVVPEFQTLYRADND